MHNVRWQTSVSAPRLLLAIIFVLAIFLPTIDCPNITQQLEFAVPCFPISSSNHHTSSWLWPLDFEPGGREFESLRARHKFEGVFRSHGLHLIPGT